MFMNRREWRFATMYTCSTVQQQEVMSYAIRQHCLRQIRFARPLEGYILLRREEGSSLHNNGIFRSYLCRRHLFASGARTWQAHALMERSEYTCRLSSKFAIENGYEGISCKDTLIATRLY